MAARSSQPPVRRTAEHRFKRPQRPALAVFRPDSFLPLAIVAKKVSKSANLVMKGEFKKGEVTVGKIRRKIAAEWPGLLQQHRYDEGAGIIVGCISFLAVGHGKYGMLQNARIVCHVPQVSQVQSG